MKQTKIKELALKLHSFPENERDWLLKQLSSDEKQIMEGLLKELSAINKIGLHHDINEIIDSRNKIDSKQKVSQQHEKYEQYFEQLDNLPVDIITSMLANEQYWIIAAVLDLYDWSWEEHLLKSMDANLRVMVRNAQSVNKEQVKDAVKYSLLVILHDMLIGVSGYDEIVSESDVLKNDSLQQAMMNDKQITGKTWWSRLWR